MDVTCVILAAGLSRRFGANKLLLSDASGLTLLERTLRACDGLEVVAVALPETAAALADRAVRVVLNHEPDRGMAHSLRLADAAIDPRHAIAVLPADLALLERDDVRDIIAALEDADVAYPARSDGTPGHPVVFSPRARAHIAELHDGDTIHELRDRGDLRRKAVVRDVPGPYLDVDTPADLAAIR